MVHVRVCASRNIPWMMVTCALQEGHDAAARDTSSPSTSLSRSSTSTIARGAPSFSAAVSGGAASQHDGLRRQSGWPGSTESKVGQMLPCYTGVAATVDTEQLRSDAGAGEGEKGENASVKAAHEQDRSAASSGGARSASRLPLRQPLKALNGHLPSASPAGSGKQALHAAAATASKASALAGCALFPENENENSPRVEVTPGIDGDARLRSTFWSGSSPRLGGPRS